MNKTKLQTLKGFRDFLPQQTAIRKRVKEILTDVFESFGFQALETPTLKYQSILLGKYGEVADNLVYKFEDQGKRKVGLKYDLTVPLARVVASYKDTLPFPFKRYQIQNVFRADKPQKGRYMEITQCDVDIFGSATPLADAEIIALIEKSLTKLGFPEFTIRINSRQVLFSVIEKAGVRSTQTLSIFQSIDKLDRKDQSEIEQELSDKGLSPTTIKEIFSSLEKAKPDPFLQEIINILELLKVKKSSLKFDPILARGLDYYTGPIFETIVTKPKIGSITGGGRYDKLLNLLGGIDLPAVGTTPGLDRVVDVILDQNLWPDITSTSAQVLITIFSKKFKTSSLDILNFLREKGIKTEIYLSNEDKLSTQIKYADKKNIPFVVIIGPDEIQKKQIILKNLNTGKQQLYQIEDVIKQMEVLI